MSFGNFPPASKMLLQKEKDRAYNLHKQRIYNIKPQVDNSPPRQHAHLLLRLKQLQTEEEKRSKIDRENKLLLQKMTQIMLNRGHRKSRNREQQPEMRASLNQEYRDRVRDRICAENLQIAKRIEKIKPMYNVDKWEEDYKQKQKLLHMWSKTTKDYQSPRSQKFQDPEDDYASDFESDDEKRKDDKLPPISKRNTGRGSDVDRSPEGRQDRQSLERELYMYYGLKKPRDWSNDQHDDNQEGDRRGKGHAKGSKNEENDVKQLYDVAKEKITPPQDIIIKCLAKKSKSQKMKIAEDFKKEYDLDLKSELRKGLGSEWFTLIDALLKDQEDSASSKAEQTKSLNVSNAVSLASTLAVMSNQDLADLKEQYLKENSNSLEAEIAKNHKDPIQRLLLTLAKGHNDECDDVDSKAADKDAQALFEFGEGRWTSANGKFLLLLETKSPAHIRSVLSCYKSKNKGKPASNAVKDECPTDYADVLSAYINSSEESASEELESLQNNLDAKNATFVNLVVTKSDTAGMGGTVKSYKSKYGTDLVSDLEEKSPHVTTSVLVALINKKPPKKGKAGKKGEGVTSQRKQPQTDTSNVKTKQKESKQDTKPKDVNQDKSKKDQTGAKSNAADKKSSSGQGNNTQQQQQNQQQQQRQKSQQEKQKSSAGDDKKKEEDDDVKKLYDAMDGLGTNEDVIIDVIVKKKNAQRQKLRNSYKERYNKDLIEELKSELSGDFEEVILALLMNPVEYDAYCLHESMAGAGTDETILIGVVCSKTAAELKDIKTQYKKAYNTDLESAIRDDTSGDFGDILVKIVSGERDQTTKADEERAENDARALHENPSSNVLKDILVKSSRAQLKSTENAYKKLYKEDIIEAIEKLSSGDAEDAFVAIIKANRDLVNFYTSRIRNALKGLGTNDTQLIRIVTSRSEIDLAAIKGKYKELYGSTLRQDVEDDTSGDYKKTLLKVIDGC